MHCEKHDFKQNVHLLTRPLPISFDESISRHSCVTDTLKVKAAIRWKNVSTFNPHLDETHCKLDSGSRH